MNISELRRIPGIDIPCREHQPPGIFLALQSHPQVKSMEQNIPASEGITEPPDVINRLLMQIRARVVPSR